GRGLRRDHPHPEAGGQDTLPGAARERAGGGVQRANRGRGRRRARGGAPGSRTPARLNLPLLETAAMHLGAGPRPFYTHLYVQVLAAIAVGVALGHFRPTLGAEMKPLGDGFIRLIKMMIAPIIFATVVVGIARMGDLKEVGRVGIKALMYFEAVTSLALVI